MKANVTTVLFDDRYILLHDRADIRNVPDITDKEYKPRGMTAMLDAIGRTLVSVGQNLAAMPEEERPGLVSVTIITDGYENASKEYNWESVRQMIRGAEGKVRMGILFYWRKYRCGENKRRSRYRPQDVKEIHSIAGWRVIGVCIDYPGDNGYAQHAAGPAGFQRGCIG